MLKNKKIILLFIICLLFIIGLNVKSNATYQVSSVNDLTSVLGKEKISVVDNTIKLEENVELKDNITIDAGEYVIDLNGKDITYNNYNSAAIYLESGIITITDSKETGRVITPYEFCNVSGGVLKITGGKYYSMIGINSDGIVKIEDGKYYNSILCDNGMLIINDGHFYNGIEIGFTPYSDKIPSVRINGGDFSSQYEALFIWFSSYSEDIVIKGGHFKSNETDGHAIYCGGSYELDLNNLLAEGYKFDNAKQYLEVIDYGEGTKSYHKTSAKEVNVIKTSDNVKNLNTVIFVDDNGKLLKKEEVLDGQTVMPPEAPVKEGYEFIGWDKSLDNINSDVVITAKYAKINNLYIDTIYSTYYTGNELKPTIVVRDSDTKNYLKEGEDYRVVLANNINAGTGKARIEGIGKYKYAKACEAEFNILPMQLQAYKNITISNEKNYTYTGKEIQPDVQVKYNNTILTNGTDYVVTYSNNVNVGNSFITVKGIGNFSGQMYTNFRINPMQLEESKIYVDTSDKIFTGEPIYTDVIVTAGNKFLENKKDYNVYFRNNINEGTASVIVSGTGNYTGQIEKNFKIIKNIKDINAISNINIDINSKAYTGSQLKTSIILKDNNYVLQEGTDYTVNYFNNRNVGKATLVITGKGNYKGVITKSFNIIPKKTIITSIKNIIIRCVVLKWQQDNNADGYEIYRSTSQNGGYSLLKSINKNSTTSYTALAQKKGTYYYKIRSYVTVNGEKVFGEFSDIQKITVTK